MTRPAPVRTILLATSNSGKLREIQSAMGDLPVRWITLKDLVTARPIPAAEETGDTFAANAIQKASYYSDATGLWTLADDSGLEVDALAGRPGVHSARYAGPQADDAANNARLLTELAGVAAPDERRTARFRCALALVGAPNRGVLRLGTPDAARVLAQTAGVIEGRILHAPRGANGFGYDPLFFIPAMGYTTAELTQEQKNEISHRGQAVRAMHPLLKELLG